MASIVPFLWFGNDAEAAVNAYVTIFPDSKITDVSRYGEAGPGTPGSVMTMEFELCGQPFMALNGTQAPETEEPFHRGAIALYVDCETQDELDGFWDKLAEGGEMLPCGWVRDRFGVAWNIVPKGISNYVGGDDDDGAERAMQAMFTMKKLDINALRKAYEG